MTSKILFFSISLLVIALLDWYVFQAVKAAFSEASPLRKRWVYGLFWSTTALAVLAFLYFQLTPPDKMLRITRNFVATGIFMMLISKIFVVLFLLADDLGRFSKWIFQLLAKPEKPVDISRSEFLSKAGLIAATTPFIAMSYGISSGAHDYRVHRKRVVLPNLPSGLDGLRIAQLSDIHSGSFFSRNAVKGGIEMVMAEKADILFFTGDLVNNQSEEMKEWIDIFSRVKAPLGVYSVLGNHDYGDYVYWPSKEAKEANLADMRATHKALGWDLLDNTNRVLDIQGSKLAVLGVENWSAKSRFPKYGNLNQASRGVEADVQVLLSHDPSHWRAEVLDQYPQIDLTLSGHTHGMQFGIEIGDFKWSPVQYVYEEWAGLYTQGNQHLYVNRGFGYIGFPGRIGIWPEITILELVKA